MLHQVRQELLAAAVQTNKEVNEYLHTTGAQAQTTLRSVQQLLGAVGGSLGEVSGTLDSYADAMTTVQPTLDAGITLANTVETYLADIEDDVRPGDGERSLQALYGADGEQRCRKHGGLPQLAGAAEHGDHL